jgi:4-hydroxybenzoate polyprenyltransferase
MHLNSQGPQPTAPSRFNALVASLRVHQWAKNLLVFIPMVLSGQVDDGPLWLEVSLAFIAMGLVASSTYLINDLLDAADDRAHWSKRTRPIAQGHLSTTTAVTYSATGMLVGFAIAFYVSSSVAIVLMVYLSLTLAYSLGIKQVPLFDGFVLAVLYTLRLVVGVVASGAPPSVWLFIFSMFLFISLSLAKRYTEIDRSYEAHGTDKAVRGYRVGDLSLVLAFGVASGFCAVIVMIFYIIEDAFQASFKGLILWLWGFPPLVLLLVCRIWLVTVRGEMHDDPVRFMLGDLVSYVLLAALGLCFALAWID